MQRSGAGNPREMANKMGIWLLMITVTLLFGALSLGFMLSGGSGVPFRLPAIFYFNTLILAGSSIFLHWGWVQRQKKGNGLLLVPSIVLGLIFLGTQIIAWVQLFEQGLGISNAGQKVSFLYVLTGLHAAHLVGGILFLVFVSSRYKRNGRKHFETAVFFWHFLGILWVYLLAVMLLNG